MAEYLNVTSCQLNQTLTSVAILVDGRSWWMGSLESNRWTCSSLPPYSCLICRENAISKFLVVRYICNISINTNETRADENSAVVTYVNVSYNACAM